VVKVPPITGGNAALDYRGVIDYTLDAPSGLGPLASRPPREGLLEAAYFEAREGEPLGVVLSLRAGSPCYQAVVWDSAGRSAATSVCLPAVDVATLLAEKNAEIAARGDAPASTAPAGDNAGTNDDVSSQRAVNSPETSTCSVARATSKSVELAVIGLAVALLFSRRRNR
jgi:hypothetical protein